MTEYRIDDLARVAGTTTRNVRVYQESGLLPRPQRRGRVAIYTDKHLSQLQAIIRLLSEGFTVKHILKFLAHGDKVKATVQFRGREMARRENGQKVLDRLLVDLTGHAVAESRSEMLGNRLYQILAPVKHEKVAKA